MSEYYHPSANELYVHRLMAKQLLETLDNGHGTDRAVDWEGLASALDPGAVGGDSGGQMDTVSEQLWTWQPIANGIYTMDNRLDFIRIQDQFLEGRGFRDNDWSLVMLSDDLRLCRRVPAQDVPVEVRQAITKLAAQSTEQPTQETP